MFAFNYIGDFNLKIKSKLLRNHLTNQ